MSALLVVLSLLPASLAAGAEPRAADGPPRLPAGWSVEPGPEGLRLVYTPARALSLRDARPEFRDGDRVLGYPLERDGRLELPTTRQALAALGSPSAWLSGRRLDGPTPVEVVARSVGDLPAPAPRALSGPADPGVPGPYDTQTFTYQLADLPVEGYAFPIEVLGEVIAPVGAVGPRPLVLFLHGRHSTCYAPGEGEQTYGEWPCPEGTLPIPSHLGYRYAARLLASQGFITVSISANGVNGQDGWVADGGAAARSALVRHHLALWRRWNNRGGDPWGNAFLGAVDLKRVILVGHSRGGEGVARAAIDAVFERGYRIAGLMLIAPTAFGRQVAPGIPTAVLLPYCDGDVIDLQGQAYVDDSRDLVASRALRSAALVMGANHNFFNTEWTPGLAAAPAWDDWSWSGDDPACAPGGPGRLTPEAQQAVGAAYIAALARLVTERDEAALSLLDGSRVRAASAGSARVLTHALGGRRTPVYRPRLGDLLSADGLSARACRGYLAGGDPDHFSDCAPASLLRLPHWLPMMGVASAPSPLALDLQWWRPGGTARITLGAPRDLSQAGSLDLRLAVDPSSPGVDLALRLVDRQGASAELAAPYRLTGLPGRLSPLAKIWAQTLRFDPAPAASEVDLTAITAIELLPRSTRGRVWLLDIYARRPGVPAWRPISLPQVSLAGGQVAEGGPGTRTEYLPLQIRGRLAQEAVLWVAVLDPSGRSSGFRLTLPRGTTEAGVPLQVEGNDQPDLFPRQFVVMLKALSAVTTGEYAATLDLTEDDPLPSLTFAATRDRVAEGNSLVFTASLSAPVTTDLWYSVTLGEVPGRPTLYTDDVPAEFLLRWSGWVPDPPEPLWTFFWPSIYFPAGETSASFEIPTVADGATEGFEWITATLQGWEDPLLPEPITVTAAVRDG